jgi:hypothetical protein
MTYMIEGFVHLCVWEVLGALWVFATARLAPLLHCMAFVLDST